MQEVVHGIFVKSAVTVPTPPARVEKPVSYWTDFLGGVDPFGTLTFRAGRDNELANVKDHGLRRTIGTAGGILGGTLAVTPFILGLSSALTGRGGGFRGFLNRFGKGAIEPFTGLYNAQMATKGLQTAQRGGQVNQRHLNSIRNLVGSGWDKVRGLFGGSAKFTPSMVTPEVVSAAASFPEILKLLQTQRNKALMSLGLAGGISGGSAFFQYGAGRRTGKDIRQAERRVFNYASNNPQQPTQVAGPMNINRTVT